MAARFQGSPLAARRAVHSRARRQAEAAREAVNSWAELVERHRWLERARWFPPGEKVDSRECPRGAARQVGTPARRASLAGAAPVPGWRALGPVAQPPGQAAEAPAPPRHWWEDMVASGTDQAQARSNRTSCHRIHKASGNRIGSPRCQPGPRTTRPPRPTNACSLFASLSVPIHSRIVNETTTGQPGRESIGQLEMAGLGSDGNGWGI